MVFTAEMAGDGECARAEVRFKVRDGGEKKAKAFAVHGHRETEVERRTATALMETLMYYQKQSNLGFVETALSVGVPVVGAALTQAFGIFAGKSAAEKEKKAREKAIRAAKEMALQRGRAEAQAQAAQQAAQVVGEAYSKRRATTITLVTIGGVAATVAGIFVIAAIRKRRAVGR